MEWIKTDIPEVIHIIPDVHGDSRGYFKETWNRKTFVEQGLDVEFVQDNESRSHKGTLRGLHYQIKRTQGKLVRVFSGTVYDVAVDLRRSSPTFGRWVGEYLDADRHNMLWVPPGFAHGFYVVSDHAVLAYKCTDYYAPEFERTIVWDDPDLAIDWPLHKDGAPLLSGKDRAGSPFAGADCFP